MDATSTGWASGLVIGLIVFGSIFFITTLVAALICYNKYAKKKKVSNTRELLRSVLRKMSKNSSSGSENSTVNFCNKMESFDDTQSDRRISNVYTISQSCSSFDFTKMNTDEIKTLNKQLLEKKKKRPTTLILNSNIKSKVTTDTETLTQNDCIESVDSIFSSVFMDIDNPQVAVRSELINPEVKANVELNVLKKMEEKNNDASPSNGDVLKNIIYENDEKNLKRSNDDDTNVSQQQKINQPKDNKINSEAIYENDNKDINLNYDSIQTHTLTKLVKPIPASKPQMQPVERREKRKSEAGVIPLNTNAMTFAQNIASETNLNNKTNNSVKDASSVATTKYSNTADEKHLDSQVFNKEFEKSTECILPIAEKLENSSTKRTLIKCKRSSIHPSPTLSILTDTKWDNLIDSAFQNI